MLAESEDVAGKPEIGDSGRDAREANGPTREYLANLSHELLTPLQAIIGFAELMFRGKVGAVSDEHKEYLGDILDSSRHLLQLIDGMRHVAGGASSIEELRPERGVQLTERRATRGESILIVDDNAASAKLARVVLEHAGYDVRTAADAEEALHALATRKPRLVLMDVQLPGMDGLELTRRLRADEATRDIVILVVSASTTPADEERARAAGCDGFVAKPMDIGSLSRVIAEQLVARGPTP